MHQKRCFLKKSLLNSYSITSIRHIISHKFCFIYNHIHQILVVKKFKKCIQKISHTRHFVFELEARASRTGKARDAACVRTTTETFDENSTVEDLDTFTAIHSFSSVGFVRQKRRIVQASPTRLMTDLLLCVHKQY